MKDFLEYLVKQIVNNAESVSVEEVAGEEPGNFSYHVNVAAEDMGLVIGKEGRTIKSLRSLARAKAIKDGIRINVELVEPEGSTHGKTLEQQES
jgi:uncharacterized protein